MRRIEQFTSVEVFLKSDTSLSEGGCAQVDERFFASSFYLALADDDAGPSSSSKAGAGAAAAVSGGTERVKDVGRGMGGAWSDFRSGFSEQMGREKKANQSPKSALFESNPREYWGQRGRLASELASARDAFERDPKEKGKISEAKLRKIVGQAKDGSAISGLTKGEQRQRNSLLKDIGSGKRISNENKSQLKHLNGKLSIREKAEALGTDLDMVDYHVTQIKNSGSALRRAADPRLSRVSPPVGNWPDGMGGSKVKAGAQKRFRGQLAKMPEKDGSGSDWLNMQYSDHAAGKGTRKKKAATTGRTAGQAGADTADREYLDPGQEVPEGAQVINTKSGARYYSTSQHQAYVAAKKEYQEGPSAEESIKGQKPKKPKRPKSKPLPEPDATAAIKGTEGPPDPEATSKPKQPKPESKPKQPKPKQPKPKQPKPKQPKPTQTKKPTQPKPKQPKPTGKQRPKVTIDPTTGNINIKLKGKPRVTVDGKPVPPKIKRGSTTTTRSGQVLQIVVSGAGSFAVKQVGDDIFIGRKKVESSAGPTKGSRQITINGANVVIPKPKSKPTPKPTPQSTLKSADTLLDLDSYIARSEEELREPLELLGIIDELELPQYSKLVSNSTEEH